MFLPHDMAHIATRFSAFYITIWCILQHDLTYIAMRWGTDFKRDASDPRKRYISFYQKIYAFYSEGILFFKKSTIVLPKKYYCFAQKVLSFFE